jgi:hypothetical protein
MVKAILGIPCAVVVLYYGSFVVGSAVFAPIKKAGELKFAPWQFRVSDFLILLAQLQVSGGIVLGFMTKNSPAERIGAIVVLWLAVAGWWIAGVRFMAKAGIDRFPRRLVFLGFAIPLGYGSSLTALAYPAVLVFQVGAIAEMALSGGRSGVLPFLLLTAIEVVVLVGLVFCRWLTSWTVARNGS